MANPTSRATVTIGPDIFNAVSVQFGVTTMHDGRGMPQMGTLATSISLTADVSDTLAVPFAVVQNLFTLANGVTRDKIQDMKIEFWTDENRNDVICTYSFRGWISSLFTIAEADANTLLSITLQPELDQQQFVKITLSN